MNSGLLSGYFSDHKIVGTQSAIGRICNASNTQQPSYFIAPEEATHALISACARGSDSAAISTEPEFGFPAYGSNNGGGAGAACHRVVFDLTVWRHIPYYMADDIILVGAGTNSPSPWTSTYGRQYAGMVGLALYPGEVATGVYATDLGGPGGTAYYSYYQNGTATYSVSAAGGTATYNGKVVSTGMGGIIAGGGGGGQTGGQKAGDVMAPWGNMLGGTVYSGYAGGGASLYAPGITGYMDASIFLQSSNVLGNKPNANDTYIAGYRYGVPGAGTPGRDTILSDSSQHFRMYTSAFLYCEFIAPR